MQKTTYAYRAGTWVKQSTKKFVYDGWHLIAELDETGEVTRYFVWGLDLSQTLQGAGGVGGLICAVDSSSGSSQTYQYCYDGNGNVGQVVNSADGAIVASYAYDPFGKTIKADGVYTAENKFKFSTKYHDAEIHLIYYGYRYYVPEMGRWVIRDPLGEPGGCNLYGFNNNGPLLFIDPLGLDWVDTSVNALGGFAKGAGKSLGTMIYEPLATVYDFEQVIWYTITNSPEKFNATSAIGKAATEGQSSSELIAGMGIAAVTAPVMIVDEYVSAIISGDPERIGSATFNLEAVLFAGSKVKLSSGLKNIIVSDFKRFIKDNKGSCSFFVERKVVKSAPKSAAIQKYFPDNNGFLGATERKFLMKGDKIDRFGGSDYSRFFSPEGTPSAARSLPAGSAQQPLRSFEVVKPFEVESGTVAPAFGQPGLGTQYRTPVQLKILINRGIIREITP